MEKVKFRAGVGGPCAESWRFCNITHDSAYQLSPTNPRGWGLTASSGGFSPHHQKINAAEGHILVEHGYTSV